MKTILLKFSGPLQSWGSSSHFETRHTDLCPSKSAVIGMIAAAFGYRRDSDAKIRRLNQLHFAVRIDQPGAMSKDYQTAHKYKNNTEPVVLDRTYVTQRYYLEDALFVVAVGHEDDDWIDEIAEAFLTEEVRPGDAVAVKMADGKPTIIKVGLVPIQMPCPPQKTEPSDDQEAGQTPQEKAPADKSPEDTAK